MFTIDYKNFLAGESTSDLVADKGFSPSSYGLNLTKSIGALGFIDLGTDRGTGVLTGNIVAGITDPVGSPTNCVLVDDEENVYTLNNDNTFTKRHATVLSSSADNITFQLGTSDLIHFRGNIFLTGNYSSGNGGEIIKITGGDTLPAIDSQWWTVTQAQSSMTAAVRHPMEIVEGSLYIADGFNIHKWDNTTPTSAEISLPQDVNITSLRKHPDGKTLMAFTGKDADFSHTVGAGGRVYYCDTVTKRWTREIEIPSQVEGSRVVNGVVYVTYGQNVGYWNGNGLTFLKKLNTSTTTYSHCLQSMENYLVVRDGLNVLAFGDLGAGMAWWNIFKNTDNTNNINNLLYRGDNRMLFAYASGTDGILYEIDYDNYGILGRFVSNKIRFGAINEISRIDIVHDLTNSTGSSSFDLHQRDLQGNINAGTGHSGLMKSFSYTNQQVDESRWDGSLKESIFQFAIAPQSDDLAYKEFRIQHEPIN